MATITPTPEEIRTALEVFFAFLYAQEAPSYESKETARRVLKWMRRVMEGEGR